MIHKIKYIFIYSTTCVLFCFLINKIIFHKDEIPGTCGYYVPCVYIGENSRDYHSEYCTLINEKNPIGLYEAEEKGYAKCEYCNGVSVEKLWINGEKSKPEQNNYFASFFISFSCSSIILILNYFDNKTSKPNNKKPSQF